MFGFATHSLSTPTFQGLIFACIENINGMMKVGTIDIKPLPSRKASPIKKDSELKHNRIMVKIARKKVILETVSFENLLCMSASAY